MDGPSSAQPGTLSGVVVRSSHGGRVEHCTIPHYTAAATQFVLDFVTIHVDRWSNCTIKGIIKLTFDRHRYRR